uniref:ABC transporter domain-containing protein n=1 Tax=Quercus lobata TaxID=97700 RepID=A0A7N2KZZ9_QUELO
MEQKEALGISVLKARGLFTSPQWPWIGLFALIDYIFLLNGIYTLALAYLNVFTEYGKVQGVFQSKNTSEEKHTNRISETEVSKAQESGTSSSRIREANAVDRHEGRGMPLPFTPISLTFKDIRYSVTMPKAIEVQGVSQNRLELLKGVSGAFRPGVLTALMGISGAGKTKLLDVLAGRKNSGFVEENITISGYPKRQETFARVSRYCEQNDIHSPLVYVEEVIELVELTTLRDALIGFPNVTGLSTKQHKRLTIAVELVAKPSIIFMDEPTTGLDARAAAIVMRTVRNMVDTGRTVLILLTQGGEEIYVGPLGPGSCHLINYFQDIPEIDRIEDGYNPTTWALEQTTREKEEALGVKFADVYKASDLFRRNKALIRELSTTPPDSQELHFPSKYSQSFFTQCTVCLWKQHKLYWRNTPYNAVRLLFGISQSILCEIIFWGLGTKRTTEQGIFSGLGALYTTPLFLGFNSASAVQPVIVAELKIYYKDGAAGMYSALPYAMAQVAIEIPYTFAMVFMNSVIVYPMIGYEWTTKFFHYLFYQFFIVLSLIYYGMMVIGISPNLQVSFVISGALYTTWNLFTGFVIPQKRIAIWWRWFAWISPISWGFNGLATSLYGEVKNKLDSGKTVAEFIKDYFGFRHDLLWVGRILVSPTRTSRKTIEFENRKNVKELKPKKHPKGTPSKAMVVPAMSATVVLK